MFHVCSYVHILHLYVLYYYVQRCEDTVSVELRYINQIFFFIIIIIVIIIIIIIIIIAVVVVVVVVVILLLLSSSSSSLLLLSLSLLLLSLLLLPKPIRSKTLLGRNSACGTKKGSSYSRREGRGTDVTVAVATTVLEVSRRQS